MRIASIVTGMFILLFSRVQTTDTNFFDFLCVLVCKAVPTALILVPIILEFVEGRG